MWSRFWDLGLAYDAKNQPHEAIDCYRRFLSLRPQDATGNNRLGKSLFQQHRTDEAVKYLRKAVGLEQGKSKFHFDLGSALLVQGKIEEAIAEFKEAIRLQDDLAMPYNNIAGSAPRIGRRSSVTAPRRFATPGGRASWPTRMTAIGSTRWPPPTPRRGNSTGPSRRPGVPWRPLRRPATKHVAQIQRHLKLFEARRPLHEALKPPEAEPSGAQGVRSSRGQGPGVRGQGHRRRSGTPVPDSRVAGIGKCQARGA